MKCYGEMMAEAAADGFDSPEAAAASRRAAKELAAEYAEEIGEAEPEAEQAP